MPESSIVVRPQPMDSATYSASSRLQAAGLRQAITLFEKAAQNVVLPRQPQPIAIADYGAATGYNSLLPVCAAIAVLRKRTRADHAILVAHTDVADNDFSTLFATLADDPDSYLKKDGATFASAVGRSFYKQILPSESIVLGWSSWAIHWLGRVPMPVPDHVHISYSADETARLAYTRQAAEDWHEFVAFRGRELAPGGRLVVLTLAVEADGGSGFRPVFDALQTTLRGLVAEEFLSTAEAARMTIPTVGRSEKEFRAPFAPSGRFEGLSIEHLELFNGEDRFFSQYQRDGDATAFGRNWAAFLRAAIVPTLAAGLDDDTDDARAAEFVRQVETGVAARLAAAPQETRIPLANVVLAKRRRSA